ncbi:MAG: hypothetical protein AAFZ15_09435 [Bacteroidota bacterium]
MRRVTLYFLLFFLSMNTAWSQEAGTDLTIGQWKQHLPFKAGISVTQSAGEVIYATAFGLLFIDKADNSLRRMTKVEGLSGVNVKQVKYNQGSEVLVIIYEDGTIDLLSEEGNQTLLGVPISSVILGEKRINDIYMANDSIAYLAGNFGMVTLNVKKGLFPNTIRMPFEVFSAVSYNGRIYAATEDGIYTIPEDNSLNIDDFANWNWVSGTNGFPINYTTTTMIPFNDDLFLDINDSLYVYDGNMASFIRHEEGFTVKYVSAEGQHLIAGFDCTTNCKGKVFIYDTDLNFREPSGNCLIFPTYAVEDESGNIWFADRASTFRNETGGGGACNQIPASGYASSLGFDIEIADGQVWVASGAIDPAGIAQSSIEGFSSLIDGEWTQYSLFNTPAISNISDFIDIKIHPENGKIYAGAWQDALVEFDPVEGSFEVFQENNSTLQTATGDPTRTRVAGMVFDDQNNLWMCNHNAPRPLSVLKADGTGFESFEFDCTGETGILRIAIDAFGTKWMVTNNAGTGVIVFNEGDINIAVDDQCRVLNTTNSELPTNDITSVQVDLDGAVWVGTKEGAVVFQCDPFNPDCRGSRPFVEVDGFGANLLEDQNVTAIGIDGANRKWFGTQTGVFVMSPEGNEQITKFTAENSPLFSDNILDIAFNYETGEAWIGTAEGLISYRSDATLGGNFHSSNVLVFPNPVRPDYEGPIAIKGLAQDATVKITDITGQLVFETDANGGQAIWDARDYNDRKVNTGVYLVFATSRNSADPDVAVAKILVVN